MVPLSEVLSRRRHGEIALERLGAAHAQGAGCPGRARGIDVFEGVPGADAKRMLAAQIRQDDLQALVAQAARNFGVNTIPACRDLKRTHHLRTDIVGANWLARAKQIIGVIDRAAVNKAFGDKVLTGNGWDHVLVIPCYSLPGYISGILFLGVTTDHVLFAPATHHPKATEAGLCMAVALEEGRYKEFKNYVFVFDTPTLALELQHRHLYESSQLLPIVGSIDGSLIRSHKNVGFSTHDPWAAYRHRQPIFWGTESTPHVISMAAAVDGMIVLDMTSMAEQHRSFAPSEWLHKMVANAVPWQTALEDVLERRKADASNFLLRLNIPPDRLAATLAGMSNKIRDKIAGQFNPTVGQRTVMHRVLIVEETDGWYAHAWKERISNAIIRVDYIIDHGDDDPHYQGRVLVDGKQYPFCARAATMHAESGHVARTSFCYGRQTRHC